MLNPDSKIKPDVILTWPSGFDYPLCRWQLTEYKNYFDQIIISIYEHGEPDFRAFIKSSFKKATIIDKGSLTENWRNVCTRAALEKSKSETVLFTEQDFFWKGEYFLDQVFKSIKDVDIVGIKQGGRLHPCFLLTRKELIEKTSKNFDPQGQDKDHFWLFSNELLKQGTFLDIRDLGLFEGVDWYHFSSLTWNLARIKDGDIREFHELSEFLVYNYLSRTRRVEQDARWIAFTYYAENLLTKFGRFLSP